MGEPHLSDIARRFAALPPEKRRPFIERAAEAGIDLAALPVPPGLADAGWSVASRAQRRLWFLWRLDPGNPAYHISGAVRLVGPLDPDLLRESLGILVARHDALRTRFRQAEAIVEQCAGPPAPIDLPVDDLAGLVSEARAARAAALAEAEREAPFDLEASPPLRARLTRLS
ncbi:condensation domain-containing protein, partial [Methylobacterium aquaticum]